MNGPIVAIEMKPEGVVIFRRGDEEEVPLVPESLDQLGTAQHWAEEALTEAKELLSGEQVSPDDGAQALRVLHDAGRDILARLAGRDGDRVGQLRQLFHNAWPTWPEPWDAIPLAEVSLYADRGFPFELLPVFGATEPFEPERDIARAGRRFLGMAMCVRRTVPGRVAVDHQLHLDESDALPVQFLRHHLQEPEAGWRWVSKRRGARHERSGTDLEAEYLRELPVALEGPWPSPPLDDGQVVRQVVDALYDSTLSLDGGPSTTGPAQIHHFACHCDAQGDDERQYRLRLSVQPGEERVVYYTDVSRGYEERWRPEHLGRERAVVVLNACRSSRVALQSAGSFPRFFVRNGHRAFIGSQLLIPDDVAAEWSRRLYGALLGNPPRTLGEATVLAARGLLDPPLHNALGLAYALYGEPELSISTERPPTTSAGP